MAKREITVTCQAGICPLCGSTLSYVDHDHCDNGGLNHWECPECGATGKEGYDEVFDGNHYDVCDGEGNPCSLKSPSKPANVVTLSLDQFATFLREQKVKQTGAFSQGVNKGLDIAISALLNDEIIHGMIV